MVVGHCVEGYKNYMTEKASLFSDVCIVNMLYV